VVIATNTFSDEDYQLCEVYQLGRPLNVYRFKPRYLHLCWWCNLFLCILGIMVLAAAIVLGFKKWYLVQTGNPLNFCFPVGSLSLTGCFAIFRGTVLGQVDLQRLRIGRVLICEHGLLKVARKIRSDHIKAVHWQDIVTVERPLIGKGFVIIYGEGKTLTLSNGYQNIDDLVERI
jgi:hypothetical protein